MMQYPWAVVGQKVTPVCDGYWMPQTEDTPPVCDAPAKFGAVYTIKEVVADDGQIWLVLEELGEREFFAGDFRPVLPDTKDAVEQMKKLLTLQKEVELVE